MVWGVQAAGKAGLSLETRAAHPGQRCTGMRGAVLFHLEGSFVIWGIRVLGVGTVWEVNRLEKPGLLADDCTTGVVAQERNKKDTSRKQGRR